MGAIAVRNAEIIVTMDEERREIPRGGMLGKDGLIDSIASSEDLDYDGAKVIDLSRHLVFPLSLIHI